MTTPALFQEKLPDGAVRCSLCAHRCRIVPGKRGICRVRENRGGTLFSLVYGKLVAASVDPIEKKPLYHFQPGSLSYSIATAGCNMSCTHCQNYQISLEAPKRDPIPGNRTTPEEVLQAAVRTGCRSISYTYTEPAVFMEFARDCGVLAHEEGLSNVFVTNGFMTGESTRFAGEFLDAANVDLKGATEEHYRKICGAALAPVLETIETLHEIGVWLEVTTLLIPGLNDDRGALEFIAGFIASVDTKIPWHISRFHPTYKMTDRPPTPVESLQLAEKIGQEAGLKYVYLGNVSLGEDITRCSACEAPLIVRLGFSVTENRITDQGTCPGCGAEFDGIP
ncbi:MAG: AmmeMemoRadiSam system radical SAM enzyme [bacterium]|nr:AmmeMemoRadiSam system radical SAM enzyme [bacterium]